MFWWIMPSNHHIPAIKWLQEYGVSFCMGDKPPATELQVKRRGSIVLISSTITSVRIFIPCGIKKLLYLRQELSVFFILHANLFT